MPAGTEMGAADDIRRTGIDRIKKNVRYKFK